MDYISNNLLMPGAAIATCILVGWVLKPGIITEEVTKNGEHFHREFMYNVMIRFIAPVLLCILLVEALGLM